MNTITVLIVSKNRQDLLRACVKRILTHPKYLKEIIIIDSSPVGLNPRLFGTLVRYIHSPFAYNSSRALNWGLHHVHGDIVALTDDDCLVSTSWLRSIHTFFARSPHVAGVFGKTMPYNAAKHRGMYCPCTTSRTHARVVSGRIVRHWRTLGYGNNMAWKKDALSQIGNFETLLGPNAIGKNANDADYALRALRLGHTLAYNPVMMVYHNRWLTRDSYDRQLREYMIGELVCYGYWALRGERVGTAVVYDNFRSSYYSIRDACLAGNALGFWRALKEATCRLYGISIAVLLYIKRCIYREIV